MTRTQKGLVLAALHMAMVAALGGKLLADRATRPRVWARTAPVDPDLPIRGRYVSLRVEVDGSPDLQHARVSLRVDGDRLRAVADPDGAHLVRRVGGTDRLVLSEPVAFFIPEHVDDPSRLKPGEELWVELTLPRRGPPRPIQLAVRESG